MSSHPGKSYPTFQLKISEEPIYSDASKDKLFGYAIEAPRGPVNEPTYIASNEEALRVFGVDFAPHFYQKPTGLVLTRVGLPNAKSASISYCIKTTEITTTPTTGSNEPEAGGDDNSGTSVTEPEVGGDDNSGTSVTEPEATNGETTPNITFSEAFTVTTVDKGESDITVKVIKSIGVAGGFTLIVDIPNVTSRTFRTLPTIKDIVKTINNNFATYLKAEQKVDATTSLPINKLGPNQELVALKENETFSPTDAEKYNSLDANNGALSGGSFGQLFKDNATLAKIEAAKQPDGSYDSSVISDDPITSYELYRGVEGDFDGDNVKSSISMTASIVYKEAFDLMANMDLIGVATLSELDVVQAALEEHIQECLDPETNILRFAVTAFLDYNNPKKQSFSIEDVEAPVFDIDSEYFIYIGQGVKFKRDDGTAAYDLPPHKAVMLYTGIRSALSYDTAIFGGEDKKILKGVVDVLPIVKGQKLYRDDREELNENGVTTFKKEYDRVTFLEGVTTVQDSDVLSYENIMSIVIYITKRLIRVAKQYQGKKMTEDLKESLKTALTSELRTIQQTDGCLVPVKYDDYDIPAYDVTVESAAMLRFNDEGELVRQSKMVAKVKIVPIGALRDIDLGVIVI
jgi:hypothetical protein